MLPHKLLKEKTRGSKAVCDAFLHSVVVGFVTKLGALASLPLQSFFFSLPEVRKRLTWSWDCLRPACFRVCRPCLQGISFYCQQDAGCSNRLTWDPTSDRHS